ncbi:MAG: hypothetical protein AB8G86_10740, partial [Saprospiraceae bacterium]
MKPTIIICLWILVTFQVKASVFSISTNYLTLKEQKSIAWKRLEPRRLEAGYLVDGIRQWASPDDQKVVVKLRKKINDRKKHLARKIDKYERKAKRKLANSNVRKSDFFLEKAEEAKLGFEEMQQTERELTQLEASPEKFTFSFNEENISYTYMDLKGTIIIEFNSYVNAVHELAHAFQHLTGEIEYLKGTGGAVYIDILDELKAYRRQYFFAPYSFNKLRSDSYIKINKSANIRHFWVQAIYFMKNG